MCSDNNVNANREDLLIREYGWVTKVVTKAWDDDNFAEELAQDPKTALHKVFPNVPFLIDTFLAQIFTMEKTSLSTKLFYPIVSIAAISSMPFLSSCVNSIADDESKSGTIPIVLSAPIQSRVANNTFEVQDTIKLQGTKIGHVGVMTKGSIQKNQLATLTVDDKRRGLTANNHSATHLMQKALRMVLGNHVEQAGSLVDQDKLRFDFTHFSPMTPEQIAQVEQIVNDEIAQDLPVVTKEMTLEEAKKTGAMALFGEKYGDSVHVVQMGDFSSELCGGTHVSNTGHISSFKIISEAGVAAGVRRIEALTSTGLMKFYNDLEKTVNELSKTLKTEPHMLMNRVSHLQEELKECQKENEKLKAKLAKEAAGDMTAEAIDVAGIKVLVKKLTDVDMNGMRDLGDDAKNKLGEIVIVFGAENGGKANLIAMATDGAIKKGAHAGNLIKEIAALVFNGKCNLTQAQIKLDEIERIVQEPFENQNLNEHHFFELPS